ncbi:MAG: isocitrate lyase/phosphoenolpyruvate mutase family protein [Roseobacter sp.]
MSQQQKAEQFHNLHVKGDPVILYNIWDAGSAKAVSDSGAKAIATGSAPVAMAQGFGDGEKIPFDFVLGNIERIVSSVSLPVSLDFEGAYSVEPDVVGTHFTRAIATGVVGFNFEDQIVGGDGLHSISDQAKRLMAARKACDSASVRAFINARTDLFLKAKMNGEPHTQEMLDEAVLRATAFADAGANGFFAPGLLDLDMIAALCERVSLPVNIIALPGAPENSQLPNVGVPRISYGPVPYKKMLQWMENEARVALSQ